MLLLTHYITKIFQNVYPISVLPTMNYFTAYCVFMYFVSNAKTQEQNEVKTYDGAQVWRINVRDDKDMATVVKLVEDRDISLWNLESNRADFLVQVQEKVKVNRVLSEHKLNHSVLIMDVQRRVESMMAEPAIWNEDSLRLGHRLNWKEYPTLKVINEYYEYLVQNFPSICNVTTIGYTDEKRPIKMVKITNGNPNNKAILITSGMHAREWVAITSALYVLDKVVSKFDNLPSYMKIFDWIFIPVLNPDGYEYSHTHDRLWRKNRRLIETCHGVDINRNFDIDWGVVGIIGKNECDDGYDGPQAFSEAESKALRNVILTIKKKPLALLDIHSYGQMILYPWSARSNPTPDRNILWNSAKTMSEAISNITGKLYKYGATYHTIYPATGTGIDWMYFTGIVLSFGIELGDDGTHGFLVPAKNIEPIGKELLLGVKELLKKLDPDLIKKRGLSDPFWFR